MHNKNPWQMLAILSTLGTEVIILTVGGGYLGNWLDLTWGMKPVFLFLGVFLGLGVGFMSAFYTLKMFIREDV